MVATSYKTITRQSITPVKCNLVSEHLSSFRDSLSQLWDSYHNFGTVEGLEGFIIIMGQSTIRGINFIIISGHFINNSGQPINFLGRTVKEKWPGTQRVQMKDQKPTKGHELKQHPSQRRRRGRDAAIAFSLRPFLDSSPRQDFLLLPRPSS